jgi:hypothetical protein
MGETSDRLRTESQHALHRLEQDVNALEYRVRQEIDWRHHFRRRPWTYLAAGFAGAFVLGLMTKGK